MSVEKNFLFDQKLRLAYLITAGAVYGVFLWSFNGIAPYAIIKIPPFTPAEFVLRWFCLPLTVLSGIFVNLLILRIFKRDDWLRILIYSIIGFNLLYLLSTVLFEVLEGDFNRTISF